MFCRHQGERGAYICIYARDMRASYISGVKNGRAQAHNTDERVKSASVRGRVPPVFATAAGGEVNKIRLFIIITL